MTTHNEPTTSTRKGIGILGAIFATLLLVVLVAIPFLPRGAANASSDGKDPTPTPTATASPTPTPTATAEACADTWPIVPADHTNLRWFYEGLASIQDAQTNEQAVAAAHDWREKFREVPYLQAAAAKHILERDINPATLTGKDGCVSQAAVDLDIEIGMELASAEITPDVAPETGYNTGVENGVVVMDTTPGVTGDRKAIKIVLSDGRTIWVMARCGNIVTESDVPDIPKGGTDNPPKPQCPDNMDGQWPNCKDKPNVDPYPRGNAPVGGGQNADPGPGPYVPPAEMEQPPAQPYVPPAPPAPAPPPPAPPTPSNPQPAPVPTPDPAPAPAPQPSAPPPTAPETGCDASAPGADC